MKMAAVPPFDVSCITKAEIGLVNQSSSLKDVICTLALHIAVRLPAQVFVDQRHKPLQGRGFTFMPGQQELRDLMRGVFWQKYPFP